MVLLPDLSRLSLDVDADGGEQPNPYDQRGLETWSEAERRADTMERLQRQLRIGEISQAEYDERMERDAQLRRQRSRERAFERDYEAAREMEAEEARAARAARERRARDAEMRTWEQYRDQAVPAPWRPPRPMDDYDRRAPPPGMPDIRPPRDDYNQGLPAIRPPPDDEPSGLPDIRPPGYGYYDDPEPQPYARPPSPLYPESQPENQLGLYRDDSQEAEYRDGLSRRPGGRRADSVRETCRPRRPEPELMSEEALMARWAQTRRRPWSP